jgi:hypothetical protein
LESLTLESLDSSPKVSRVLAALAAPGLHTLELSRCSLAVADMKFLAESCPAITAIKLNSCKFASPHAGVRCSFTALQCLTMTGYCFFYEDNVMALFGNSCDLSRLTVGPNNIKKAEWVRLLPEMSELRSLSLSRCSSVDDEVLERMAESCVKLENVLFRQMPHLTVTGVHGLAVSCQRLKNIDLLI